MKRESITILQPLPKPDAARLRSQCSTHHHACDCRERKLLAVLKPHMTELKLEGLRGNQIALQAFVDVDETWRELYGCSIEDDDRVEQPNVRISDSLAETSQQHDKLP